MKKIDENTKVTLTLEQLKKLVKEGLSDNGFVSEDTPVKPFRASDLRKYGFEHEPGADFTDDGNRFYVYRLKGTDMGVSYLRDGNEIYIGGESFGSVRKAKEEVGYAQYSKLPGYRDLEMLNGVSDTSITPDKMQQLVKALTDFEEAILDAASNVQGADPAAVEDLNQKMQEVVNQAYSAHRDELKDALDSIVSKTYKKNFDFYLIQVLRELSSIKSLNRPITPGTKSEWDRNRVQNPEKTLADIEESISRYSEDFRNYLDKLKQL